MRRNNCFGSKMNWKPEGVEGPGGTTEPPVATDDFSFIPEEYRADGKPDLTRFAAHYQEVAAERARLLEERPAAPEAYDFALPDGFTVEDAPEGWTPNMDAANPLFEELGGVLKEIGAPADVAPKLSSLLARYEAGKEAAAFDAWKQDMAQLGPSAEARAMDVKRKLETLLPSPQVEALFSGPRISADGIRALEKLVTTRSLQAPAASPAGPDIESLTPMQKLQLANRQRA